MEKLARILIVDDERFNINVLVNLLRSDYETMIAKNGEEALKRVHSDMPPDLILLDIMMPGMDGYEVCRQLKTNEMTRDIPVIFVTAMNQHTNEEKGLQLGGIDYITKPISPALVKLRVDNHVKLKRQTDLLREMASLDGLTGIPNRRRFDEFLDLAWRGTMRYHSPLSMILMDIDYFKLFNDTYGHPAGDDCLKQVAHVLSKNVNRGIDLVARYGGEEFACLLPDTDAKSVWLVGERLRNAVAALNIPHNQSKAAPFVTISLGAVTRMPAREEKPTLLIEQADMNLYVAKKQGRNRLCA